MIVGNDVSRWQGDINFDVYKNNSNFLIIKTSEGVGFVDPKFTRNIAEARRVGLPLGFYHFARPDLNLPETEAVFFVSVVNNVGPLREGEIYCLDYEPPKPHPTIPVVEWCLRFLKKVESLIGVKPLIYLNKSQVKGFDWRMVVEGGYGLWLACYDSNTILGDWHFLTMHQWTSSQQVPGVQGNVDGNYFFGTVEQFKAYGYKKPVTPSSSVSPSQSPSSSISQSISPSASTSPSVSPSVSRSFSPSSSVSPSPSDGDDACDKYMKMIMDVAEVVNSSWWWVGKNSWQNKRKELRNIINQL